MTLWRMNSHAGQQKLENTNLEHVKLTTNNTIFRGSGSSVGIATDYGLDGPGSNPGGDETFHLSRPALGPTQPPVQ